MRKTKQRLDKERGKERATLNERHCAAALPVRHWGIYRPNWENSRATIDAAAAATAAAILADGSLTLVSAVEGWQIIAKLEHTMKMNELPSFCCLLLALS